MFIRCSYVVPYVNGKTPDRYIFRFEDTNFEERVEIREGWFIADLCTILIEVYERRGLPVSKNLFLAIQFIERELESALSMIIDQNKRNNPHYKKYERELKKYLLFS